MVSFESQYLKLDFVALQVHVDASTGSPSETSPAKLEPLRMLSPAEREDGLKACFMNLYCIVCALTALNFVQIV